MTYLNGILVDTATLTNTISDSGLYKLAGNAVSLPVVKLIADKLVPELYKLI